MWVDDCYKKGVSVDSNKIQKNAKSLYDNLKQKEGEGAKAGEFNGSKGWSDNFRKKFGFDNVRRTGEAAPADQEEADKLPEEADKLPDT